MCQLFQLLASCTQVHTIKGKADKNKISALV